MFRSTLASVTRKTLGARSYHSIGSSERYSNPSVLIEESLDLKPKATELLLKALDTHVPVHGFSETAIIKTLRDSGYSDAASLVFPNGRGGLLDLVLAHLARERSRLFKYVTEDGTTYTKSSDVLSNVSELVTRRIKGNEAISQHLPTVLSTLAMPANASASLTELHNLSDDIWYLAGDDSHDFAWYTRRASLSSIYVATELFMSQDRSSGFRDTYEFLDRRLNETANAQYAVSSVSEWAWFNGISTLNIIKAQLSRG